MKNIGKTNTDSRVKSVHGVTSLYYEKGKVWASGLRKEEFEKLGIEVNDTGNRYGHWYYLINKEDLEKYPFQTEVL